MYCSNCGAMLDYETYYNEFSKNTELYHYCAQCGWDDYPIDEEEQQIASKHLDPCDIPDDNGNYHCPYEDYPRESERCRVCCGKGVDE